MFLTGGDNELACYDRSTAYTGLWGHYWFLHAMICENWVDNYFTCLFLFLSLPASSRPLFGTPMASRGFSWHVKMEFLPPLPHLSLLWTARRDLLILLLIGGPCYFQTPGGYFELYGFLYDTIMQVIKDRLAA